MNSELDLSRIVTAKEIIEDQVASPISLRPKKLSEYVGQTKAKQKLQLTIDAAKQRGESVEHVLLAGPPGLGKTTLAHIIATEMGSELHLITGPNIEKKADLAAILTNLKPHDVVFIDEIHRIPRAIEEILYSAMEDFKMDLIVGTGPAAQTYRLDLPPFTLIGATTRTGLLTSPLRDRFGIPLRLEFYPATDLAEIVVRSSQILGISLDKEGAFEIANRSRGTPRIANRLLKRVRDFAQVKQKTAAPLIDQFIASEGLHLFEIDRLGLDPMDRQFLRLLIEKFDGGPVGIDTLALALGEEADTLEDVYESYLMQQGFLQRTPRGRVATRLAYEHLGLST